MEEIMRELNFDREKRIPYCYTKEGQKAYTISKKENGYFKARGKVRWAIESGKLNSLVKNNVDCVFCYGRAEIYHHKDYNKPLDVVPVCRKCNHRLGEAIKINR